MVQESPQDGDVWLALGRDYEIAGRFERAQEAYQKALPLLLGQRHFEKAAQAYSGLVEYGAVTGLTPEQQFDLANVLAQTGHARQAFDLFLRAATEHPTGERGETALIRAAEVARLTLKDTGRAADCYRRLLAGYPFGNWRALAQERLRELGFSVEMETPTQRPSRPLGGTESTVMRMREGDQKGNTGTPGADSS